MKVPDLYQTKVLTPIETKIKDVQISAFDIENDPNNKTTIVGHYDGSKFRDFANEGDFLTHYLSEQYNGTICYAHNGSGFDFQRLLVPLVGNTHNVNYRWFLNGGKLICGSLTRKQERGRAHRWTFSDSARLYTGSLDKLAQGILGSGKVGTYDTSNYQKLKEYNELDCRLLYGLMDKLKEASRSLGFQLKVTAASCSFDYLRRQLPYSIYLPISEYFQRSYFGGRVLLVEPEYEGEGFCVDINSLYPWAMCQVLPKGKPKKFTPKQGRRSGKYAWDILRRTTGFVRARVRVASRPVPPLPYLFDGEKDIIQGEGEYHRRIIYPSGTYDGLWAIPDLLSLDPDLDYIYIRDVYAFEGSNWLAGMVEKLYDYRLSMKEPHMKAAIKILLNSGYGKFGEKKEKSALVNFDTNDCKVIETSEGVMLLNKLAEEKQPMGRSPAIAAYITAWSRYRWHQLFDKYQDKVLYLDTDSAYLKGNPDDFDFPITDKLGDLKVECRFDTFRGLASKVYGYHEIGKGWTVKAKGFPMGSSFDIHKATKTIVTGRNKDMNYREHGEQFLKSMVDHYAVRASRPCTFATANTNAVRPGDWAVIERIFNSNPGTVRTWLPGMRRTLAPRIVKG